MSVKEGQLLWQPTEEIIQDATITKYMDWLKETNRFEANTYEELWNWSVTEVEQFWKSIWDFYGIKSYTPYETVLKSGKMPGAEWFSGSTLNYAEHILRNGVKGKTALFYKSENRPLAEMKWEELIEKTASVATYLKRIGVKPGDRVVSYMPNIPETIIAFLATASVGAIWSSCSPEFGVGSTLGRFKQIEPKVFFTVDGYMYNGKRYDRLETVEKLLEELPTVEQVVVVPYIKKEKPQRIQVNNHITWNEVLTYKGELTFEPVPFNHPLWILYSSGTTGLPKAIVQGHGGILLSQLSVNLQSDITENDRFFWYTTTGWMMWNVVLSSLLTGATAILYDGSPAYPDLGVLWRLAEDTKMTSFGTSPPYILNCMKAGIDPKTEYDLSHLKVFAYTGSPLSPEGFQWIHDHVKENVRIAPASGGTDICSGIVGSTPILPVFAGEIPCKCLGVSVYSFDEEGKPVINEIGEMVLTKPYPSMPLYFWNDKDNQRYLESYFDYYPGIWRHGDLLKITDRGTAVIYGRSDATINRQGVRSGSSEIYNAVEGVSEVLDSLIVDLSGFARKDYMPLFVVLRDGILLTDEIKSKINEKIKEEVSPRHVPDEIFQIKEVPRTLTGKKMEIPVRKILLGIPVEQAASTDAMLNPQAIHYFIDLAQTDIFSSIRKK